MTAAFWRKDDYENGVKAKDATFRQVESPLISGSNIARAMGGSGGGGINVDLETVFIAVDGSLVENGPLSGRGLGAMDLQLFIGKLSNYRLAMRTFQVGMVMNRP